MKEYVVKERSDGTREWSLKGQNHEDDHIETSFGGTKSWYFLNGQDERPKQCKHSSYCPFYEK